MDRGSDLFTIEVDVLDSLVQSTRRKEWIGDALACALSLPRGAVRDAINRSPGVAGSLRDRRAAMLLKEADVEHIYREFALIREVLSLDVGDVLQPVVIWLSARVISED